MGDFYLVPSHEDLHIFGAGTTDLDRRTLVSSEFLEYKILQDRPYFLVNKEQWPVYRALFRALYQFTQETPFDATLSGFSIDEDEQYIVKEKALQWVEFSLGQPDNIVGQRSHDVRTDGEFHNIFCWPQEHDVGGFTQQVYADFIKKWSNPEMWLRLIDLTITVTADSIRRNASDGEALQRAESIERALPHGPILCS